MSALLKVLLVVATALVVSQAQLTGTPPNCESYTWEVTGLPENITQCTTFNGTVTIDGSDLTNTTFLSQVTSIEELAIKNNGKLVTLDLPNLTLVNGTLQITTNVNLTTVTLTKLATINDDVTISGADKLAALNFPALTTVNGDFSVTGLKVNVQADVLTSVAGSVNLNNGAAAGALNLPIKLANVGVDVNIQTNKATSIAGAALKAVVGKLQITGNDAVTAITFDTLDWLGSLAVDAKALTSFFFKKLNKTSVTQFKTPMIKCAAATAFYTQVNSTKPADNSCDSTNNCLVPPAPTNGTSAYVNGTYGAPAQNIQCNDGNAVTGAARTCTINGTWDQPEQTCTPCAAGKFHKGNDAAACAVCADNFAAPLIGMDQCYPCPNNTFSGGATPGTAICYCLNNAKYYPIGDAGCTGKTSGASSAMALPALVLAALAAITMFVRA